MALAQPTCTGTILELIRTGAADSRPELARLTGFGRSTVAERVDRLVASGLVTELASVASNGGRPPMRLAFNCDAGVVLAVSLDPERAHLEVANLAGIPLAEGTEAIEIGIDHRTAMEQVHERFDQLLADAGRDARAVRAVGIGLPRPTEFGGGDGWHARCVGDTVTERYGVPVVADTAVSLMAAGEHRLHWADTTNMLFVHIGAEISCGIVSGGRIVRGTEGAAGEIGHIALANYDDVSCRCGGAGCLDAVAGGRALARKLAAEGLPTAETADVVAHIRQGHPQALRAVRDAGRDIGEVLAVVTQLFSPSLIVFGGELAACHEPLLAGAREVLSRLVAPRIARDLRTAPSRLGARAAVVGPTTMAVELALAPETIDCAVERDRKRSVSAVFATG